MPKKNSVGPISLSTYIEDTINQIIQGVKQSQNNNKDNGAIINPKRMTHAHYLHYSEVADDGREYYYSVQDIQFKVAIAYEFDDKLNEIRITVPVFDIDIAGDQGINTNALNQIEFSIPIVLPH